MGRSRAARSRERHPVGVLLLATLVVAFVAWLLHLATVWVVGWFGADPPSAWELAAEATGVDGVWLRLVLFAALHAALALAAVRWWRADGRRRLAPLVPRWNRLRGRLDYQLVVVVGPERIRATRRGLRIGSGVVVAALLGVLVIQPTLVPLHLDRQSWLERAANFADGTASASILDSVVGLARWFHADPVPSVDRVDPDDFDADLDADRIPLIDRWDPFLLEAADGDRELFAQTKAFMWVESGGRQFAVSSTGCEGLMQFCATTAQRGPFHGIFGAGRVATCGCADCSVPLPMQVALETNPLAPDVVRDAFPCDLADARFDPERSVRAGVAYVRELGALVGGHLPLMYVGYNAGPGVASTLYRQVGDRELGLDELRPYLVNALRPYQGKRAEARANGLISVHLPKLLAAYERWRPRPEE